MAGNSNIRDKAKLLWIKGMKTIGNTATNIANNTKYKVDEMTLQNRRRELGGDLSSAVYAMWMKGTEFPPELTRMLEEMQQLDERLNDMRAERYAQGKTAPSNTGDEEAETEVSGQPDDTAAEGVAAAEEPDEETEVSNVITAAPPSVLSEIEGCFDHEASVDKMAEKVNTSLDQLTDKIRSFAPETPEPDGKKTLEEKP
uniref:Uncharacterized protein n=1 Tax=uncultured bacterium Contig1761 TaxID=1393505 RepID=W0FLT8_9BACT|nr:hypothetical protein [uncultured bacterium Contig1761]